MKHYLLSLMALTTAMFTSASAWAQTELPDPVLSPFPEVEGNWVTPEAGGTYYIYNVKAGQFLGTGRDYGTRAITTNEKLVKLTDASAWAVGANKNAIIPFQVQEVNGEADAEGTWFYLQRQKCSGGAGSYLAHDGNNAWADFSEGNRDNNKNGYWRFDKQEDGSYMIKPHDIVTLTNEEGTPILDGEGLEQLVLTSLYYGVDGGNMDIKASYTWSDLTVSDTHFTTWRFLDASKPEDVEAILNNTEARNQFNTAFAIYNAKLALKATIAQAEEAEIDATEVTKAITIYNNAEATLEQVQQQNNHLQALLAGQKYNDISEFQDASEDNPQDVTEYVLVNPNFDGNINGWTITVGGQNLMYQGRTDGVVNEEKNWVSITGFIEAWIESTGSLGDGTISQTIYGLPKGKYVLECDAMATRQGGLNGKSAEEAVEGAYIFIQGAESEVRNPIKAPDTQPKHWSVVFISEGDDALTFGLKVESTTANWISADNFKLTYYGATTKTQAQLELETAVQEVEAFHDGLDDLFCNKDVKSAFETAFTNASDLVSDGGTDDACLAAKQALEEKTAALNSSVEAYKVLLSYLDITGGKALLDKYYNIAYDCGMTELTTKWNDWKDNWEQAYEEGTMTDEEIYEKTASIYPDLKAAWLDVDIKNVKVGTDLTWLMTNPGFDTNLDGWTVSSGSATPAISSGLAEVYQAKFDIHQIIEHMPAGAYKISLQGFTRNQPGGNRMAFTPEEQAGTTFAIYTPTNAANIQSILEGASTELIAQRGEEVDPDKYIGVDGGDFDIAAVIDDVVYYMPNGMASARKHFDLGRYQTSVKVVNASVGDLDIGIRCTTTQEWCLWDEITITYEGEDLESYKKIIKDNVDILDGVYGNILVTEEGQNRYDTTVTKAENVKNTLTGETAIQQMESIVAEINTLIDYLKEGHELAISLRDDLSDYDEIRLANPFLWCDDENGFAAWVSDLYGFFPDEDYGMLPKKEIKDETYKGTLYNNEALQKTAIDMNRRMADYVMQFAAANPLNEDDGSYYGNATEAIFNPRYTEYADASQLTTKGWTMEVADSIKGKAIGLDKSRILDNYNVAEVFDCSNFVISQTVRGLYPGWYLLTVDGFYRPGLPGTIKTSADAQKQYVEMFAESGDLKYSHPLKNIMVGAQTGTISSDEATVTINEVQYYIPNRLWSAADYMNLDDENIEIPNIIAVETADNSVFNFNSIYRNGMLVQVDESGVMTFGLRKEDHWVDQDWTTFGNWTLTYFGDEENIPTAVETVEAKSAKNMIQDIFTIDGRQAQRLQRGINIVRTSDGKIHKVLVK